ncbi:MAG: hypothetical protein IIY62_00285 [Kiritimatiellae bacterium]|nr:hypothetical protein [Kiritimatiellia bacterium]
MADKIIVVEKKRGGGCGCLVALALAAGVVWMMYSCHSDMQRTAAQIRAEEAAKTPEQRAAEAISKPLDDLLPLKFSQALRQNLRDPDSYKPGSIRYHDHPNGYAYFHDYRARNGFGGYTQEVCGLLCATNTGKRAWTFYNQDALPQLLKECGIE